VNGQAAAIAGERHGGIQHLAAEPDAGQFAGVVAVCNTLKIILPAELPCLQVDVIPGDVQAIEP